MPTIPLYFKNDNGDHTDNIWFDQPPIGVIGVNIYYMVSATSNAFSPAYPNGGDVKDVIIRFNGKENIVSGDKVDSLSALPMPSVMTISPPTVPSYAKYVNRRFDDEFENYSAVANIPSDGSWDGIGLAVRQGAIKTGINPPYPTRYMEWLAGFVGPAQSIAVSVNQTTLTIIVSGIPGNYEKLGGIDSSQLVIEAIEIDVNSKIYQPEIQIDQIEETEHFNRTQFGYSKLVITHSYNYLSDNKPIKYRITDGLGLRTLWQTARLEPIASFTIDDSESPTLKVDATASFGVTAKLYNYYRWDLIPITASPNYNPPFSSDYGAYTIKISDEPITELDITDYLDGLYTYIIRLIVKDDSGRLFNVYGGDFSNEEMPDQIGLTGLKTSEILTVKDTGQSIAAHTPHGETFHAVAEMKGVADSTVDNTKGTRIYRSPASIAYTRSPLAFLPGHTKPCMVADAEGAIYLFAIPPGGNPTFYNTPDSGDNFYMVVTSPIGQDNYNNITPFQHMAHGMLAVAGFAVKTTNLYFCLYDGNTWGAITLVDNLPSGTKKSLMCFQEIIGGSARLRISNGTTFDYCSNDYGETWQATS